MALFGFLNEGSGAFACFDAIGQRRNWADKKVITMNIDSIEPNEIFEVQSVMRKVIVNTPTLPLDSDRWQNILPQIKGGAIKLELFQQVGSFKARGAYLGIECLSDNARKAGVVAASGGNHALAVSWAARKKGVSAKIAIPKASDPIRIKGCRDMGAEVVLCEDIMHAFEIMENCVTQDGLTMLHPFESRHMTVGAATCGAEFIAQHPDLEVVIVPVGGGGLISGFARAIKLSKPEIKVIGVEPYGADTMYQSFERGEPVRIAKVETCADSLGAPTALPFTYSVIRENVDKIVRVEDKELLNGMRIYRDVLGLSVEPACSASLAGAIGPLKDDIKGQNVGLIACGSNISPPRYQQLLGIG